MSISLALLISFQSWWLIGSFKVQEHQIKKDLDAALYSSLNKEAQFRYEEFKKTFKGTIQFRSMDESAFSLFMNTVVPSIFPERGKVDLNKLGEIFQKELRKRKIDSEYQFEITDLLAKQKFLYPEKGEDYIKAAESINYPLGSYGNTNIKVTITSFDHYIFSNMKWALFVSIFLVIFSAACLFYMLYTIIRQKQISEMKNDFVSNMTHEFKTPIATVSAAMEAIQTFRQMGHEEKTDKYVDISKKELKKLNNLVENILNISVYDKKDFALNIQELDICEFIKECIKNYKINNHNLHISFDYDEECIIKVDRFHFQNAITNLIDNAIKYSEKTKVVEIRLYKQNGRLFIAVKDYGKGISKEQQKHIFDKFYRAHTGDVHKVKGYGLGLSYVKKIVEKHKGSISVNSSVGKGSEFFISLPIG